MRGEIHQSFLRTLIEDVQDSTDRLETQDTPSHRRDVVRTIFAAIEGVAWTCREFVREAAKSLDVLDPVLDMALREQTYFVSERGKVTAQTRYISFTAMFKLISRVSEEVCVNLKVNFADEGWQSLLKSLETRNKLMHPKSFSDLSVAEKDVTEARNALNWILTTSTNIMESVSAEIKFYNHTARELVDGLRRGDPAVTAEYQAALERIAEEERRQ